MNEEDFLELTPKKQDRLIAYLDSQARLKESEAYYENQKKWRIVFERAPKETIPFIIYCVEVVFMSLIGLFRIIDFEGEKLYIGSANFLCTAISVTSFTGKILERSMELV